MRGGILQCAAAADDQEAQIAGRDARAQALAGLDDDFRPDPGGIAHGDGEMARGHEACLSMSRWFSWSRCLQRSDAPKAPDFDITSTPAQRPLWRSERGRPGTMRPVTLRARAPSARQTAFSVSPPATI